MIYLIGLTVSGKVIDSESGRPMAYAVVILHNPKDTSKLTGTYTDEKGTFVLKNVKAGRYLISADFIGYRKTFIGPVEIERDTNIGTISLSPQPIRTEEVVVEATPPKVRYEVDRKVITPSADIVSRGGSAADALRGVPGVKVDPQGNVEIRGSDRYILFVDGRPTNMSLKEIPASQVERIEVITNPSAEYDAEGNAIINIVMKRRKVAGYGLSLQGVANSYLGGMLNGTFGLSTGRFQPYIRLRLTRWINRPLVYGEYILGGDTVAMIAEDAVSEDRTAGGEAGFRYLLSEKDRISFEVGSMYKEPTVSALYEYVLNGDTNANFSILTLTSPRHHLLLGYDHDFSQGHTLSLTLYGSHYSSHRFSNDSAADGYVQYEGRSVVRYGFGEIRYGRRMGDFKLNAGYKGEVELYSRYDSLRVTTPNFPELPDYSFKGRDETHAMYATLSSNLGKLSYKVGLRLEYMDRKFNVTTEDAPIRVKYFAPFPTLHLSYPYGGRNRFYVSLSRRVWRPYGDVFLPIRISEGRTEIREGNPEVLPEYSNTLEVGTNYSLGPLSITPEIYASKRENIFDVQEYPYGDGYNVMVKRFINAGSGYDYGGSLYLQGSFLKGLLRFNLSPNYRRYSYANITSSEYGGSASLTVFAFVGMLQAQIDYTAPRRAVWGRYGQQIYTQIAFMTQVKGFSLVLSAMDPFNLLRYEITIEGEDYYSYKCNRMKWPNVSLVLQYNFSRDFRLPQKREVGIENTGERLLK